MPKRRIIKIGEKSHKLTVLDIYQDAETLKEFVKLSCQCGNEKTLTRRAYIINGAKSCGCLHKDAMIKFNKSRIGRRILKPNKNPVSIGQKFSRLTVIGFDKKNLSVAIARCQCGNELKVYQSRLRSRNTQSCGCLRNDKTRERGYAKAILGKNMKKIPGYFSWNSMKARCLDSRNKNYSQYGGRGITVCKRWLEFPNFYADMGERPKGLTIERINNNGNYEPGNCRWATIKEQNSNKRNSKIVILDGDFITGCEASRRLGLVKTAIINRAFNLKCTHQQACDYYASKRK